MYKHILLPVDPAHIEEMDPILDLAEHLKAKGGKITLLSVVEDIPSYVASQLPNEFLVNARNNAKEGLDGLVGKRKMDASIIVETGHAAAKIKQVQQKQQCDLIIISSHKPTTLDYVLGSTASHVVRRAECPVFVIR